MASKKRVTEPASAQPKNVSATPAKARKPRSKGAKKAVAAAPRGDALLGRRFTHVRRAEWGIGTVVDGAENAIVLAWSDGTERRTARSYMDHLVEVP